MIDRRTECRANRTGQSKRTFRARAAELPDGTFITLDDDAARLIWRRRLITWASGGYTASEPLPRRGELTVLTPRSTVRAIRAGYVPAVHHTADRLPERAAISSSPVGFPRCRPSAAGWLGGEGELSRHEAVMQFVVERAAGDGLFGIGTDLMSLSVGGVGRCFRPREPDRFDQPQCGDISVGFRFL